MFTGDTWCLAWWLRWLFVTCCVGFLADEARSLCREDQCVLRWGVGRWLTGPRECHLLWCQRLSAYQGAYHKYLFDFKHFTGMGVIIYAKGRKIQRTYCEKISCRDKFLIEFFIYSFKYVCFNISLIRRNLHYQLIYIITIIRTCIFCIDTSSVVNSCISSIPTSLFCIPAKCFILAYAYLPLIMLEKDCTSNFDINIVIYLF